MTLIDVLKRGGLNVTTAAVGRKADNLVTMAHGIRVQGDVAIEDCADKTYDVIVLPGVRLLHHDGCGA